MNKTELIAAAAEKSGLSKKDTESALNAAIDVITAALTEGDKIQLVGFGSFEVKNRAARTGRNPKTKEPIEIPASKLPMFKHGKALKDAVSKYALKGSAAPGICPGPLCSWKRRYADASGQMAEGLPSHQAPYRGQ